MSQRLFWGFFMFLLVENFVDLLCGPGNNGLLATDANGAIHNLGVFQEQTNQCVGRVIVVDIFAKITKGAWVNQVFGFSWKQVQKIPDF